MHMKSSIFLTCLLGVSLIAFYSDDAPTGKVPSIVFNNFKSHFPSPTTVEWIKVKDNYEAEFHLNSIAYQAIFNGDGQKLMQKNQIAESDLPATIILCIKDQFNSYRTDDVEQVLRGGINYYQVELKRQGKPDQKLVFSSEGKENTTIPYWD